MDLCSALDIDIARPLPGAAFGATVRLLAPLDQALPRGLPQALDAAGGLLLIPGLHEIAQRPELLVAISRLFGPEVENYRPLMRRQAMVHPTVDEIFVVTNVGPGARNVPAPPDPLLTPEGRFPVQYPQRTGWHTDQSFRRPPPDISLFYAVQPVARGSGQTLFASGALAFDALPAHLRAKAGTLRALHCHPYRGRSRRDAEAGRPPPVVAPHERSQPQPVVRTHPVTGRKALYLCDLEQIDWYEGPLVGMEPGPFGEGASLHDALMSHYTRPEFVYVHEWTQGDLLVWDNRCLVHAATWFDAAREDRVMWRTTVSGNPGEL